MTKEAALPDPRPLMQCEYSHAMGNSNGGFDEYWKLYKAGTRARGGAIWDWVDQGHREPIPPRVVVKDRTRHGLEALFVGATKPGEGGEGYLEPAGRRPPEPARGADGRGRRLPATAGDRRGATATSRRLQPYVSKGELGFQLMQDGDQLQLWLRLDGETQPLLVRAPAPAGWWNAWHRITGHVRRQARPPVRRRQAARVGREGRPPVSRSLPA